ncbi:hypothetical protein CSOJ01_06978 [Colletotrichum sojae]|uniref:Uncharacterized protein n=1 Tax=Colletotrichum sojae TaxID=2175907 RepID=A0A8H6JAG5_9PEZI|nr:hypothetical protein CSOJ01_06978 [Colletotrichum sojae]
MGCSEPDCCDKECNYDRVCRVDSCSRKHAYWIKRVHGIDVKVYSDFCVDRDSMCKRSKDTNHRFCSHHRRCGVEGCGNRGDCPRKVPLPWMCPSHICRIDECYKQRHDRYDYCKDHRCKVLGCYERRFGGIDAEWCEAHASKICRHDNCRESVHLTFFCKSHQKCPVKDCKHFKHHHKDGLWDFCETHHLEYRCVFKDCTKRCIPNCRYCTAHKCTFEGCVSVRENEKDKDQIFCKEHGCEVTRCYAVAMVVAKGYAPYCRRHTCTVADCREVCEGAQFCSRHCCTWDGCDKTRIDASAFCVEHECRRAGCHNKCKLRLGYCEEHCCKIDQCLNFNDTGSDKLCYEHSRKDLLRKVKHFEDRLRGRGHETRHYEDLRCRHEKLRGDYDEVVIRLNASLEEIRCLRATWISEEDNRIWRKDWDDRHARLLYDLNREQKRVEHWERKAGELLRRVDEVEVLLAEERRRHPSTALLERQIEDLICKVECLEEELRCEREKHIIHEGRQREIDRLLCTVAELEKKLANEHLRGSRYDELLKKLNLLQGWLSNEKEKNEILLEEIARRDEYDRCRRDRCDRRRFRSGSWERRSGRFPGGVC